MKKNFSATFVVLASLFSVCLVGSNLFETKLIQLGPILTTGGILLFPISYIINDLVAEVWGFRRARFLIWTGFSLNFLIAVFGLIAVALPDAPYWTDGPHFNYVFSLSPRIAIASFIAFLFGSFINAYVISRMKVLSKGKNFSLRAIVSTLAGESADSIIFFPIAFYGIVPNDQLIVLIITQASMKTLYEIIVLPFTNIIVKYVKKKEQTDVYDKNISYKLF